MEIEMEMEIEDEKGKEKDKEESRNVMEMGNENKEIVCHTEAKTQVKKDHDQEDNDENELHDANDQKRRCCSNFIRLLVFTRKQKSLAIMFERNV